VGVQSAMGEIRLALLKGIVCPADRAGGRGCPGMGGHAIRPKGTTIRLKGGR